MSPDPNETDAEEFDDDLNGLVKNSKVLLKEGEYEESKKETQRLEKEIRKVKKDQDEALSEFKKLRRRIDKKDGQGYDVSEADSILEEAKEALADMRYEEAFSLIDEARGALERALFLPFPLLEKNVSLNTVIRNNGGAVNFEFEVINRMEKPLGEILLNLSTPPGFKDLPEKKLGMIRPKEDRSVEAILKREDKIEQDSLADHIINNRIIVSSSLDCSYKYPVYKISIRNISDQPLKDITLKPFTPGSLESKETRKKIEWLDPSKEASVTFKLYPKSLEEEMKREEEEEEEEKEEESSIQEEEVKEEVKEEEEFLSEGSNYLLLGEELEHSYSIFDQYFSEQKDALVISTTIPYKISGEFGVEVNEENLIWLSNVESKYFQVIHPTKINDDLTDEIKEFVNNNEEGVIFIDKLERMVVENGFKSTVEFLEEVWETTASSEFTLLTHVNPEAFSEEEIKTLKKKLRLYQVL